MFKTHFLSTQMLFHGVMIALVVIVTLMSFLPQFAYAATFTAPSYLMLGTSKPSAASNLKLQFTATTTIAGDANAADDDGLIVIRFPQDATTEPFAVDAIVPGDIVLLCTDTDITVNTVTETSGGGVAGLDTITIGLNQTLSGVAQNITAGDSCTVNITNTAVTNGAKVAAAGTADIYSVSFETQSVAGTAVDYGSTRVAIIDDVDISATVATTLTLTVAAITTSSPVRSSAADVTSTAITIPWGTLVPNIAKQAGHTLTIVTNAPSGYDSYIIQSQNLTSGSDDIDQFKDGTRADDSAATAWTQPAVNVNSEGTQGHMGYGTSDTSVFASATTFAGIPTYTGATSSSVDTTGLLCNSSTATTTSDTCTVEFQVEISGIQPAGTYTNEIQYILVPKY